MPVEPAFSYCLTLIGDYGYNFAYRVVFWQFIQIDVILLR
jgi:hypothetical protein